MRVCFRRPVGCGKVFARVAAFPRASSVRFRRRISTPEEIKHSREQKFKTFIFRHIVMISEPAYFDIESAAPAHVIRAKKKPNPQPDPALSDRTRFKMKTPLPRRYNAMHTQALLSKTLLAMGCSARTWLHACPNVGPFCFTFQQRKLNRGEPPWRRCRPPRPWR